MERTVNFTKCLINAPLNFSQSSDAFGMSFAVF
jgi:hypothetical protein